MRRFVGLIVMSLVLLQPRDAKAEPMRDFIMSCSYGVLAGTLVGAATLAFSDKPGDNLNKVARGASFGLYAGILLGVYVVYGVSDGTSEEEIRALGQRSDRLDIDAVPIVMSPLFSAEHGRLDGVEVRYNVMRF